jgi:hypothetical protein
MMKAVIDRFEGDLAVLILEGSQARVNVPRASLPKKSQEGSWLQVEIEDGEVRKALLDEAETARTRQRIDEKLERLRRGEHRKKG